MRLNVAPCAVLFLSVCSLNPAKSEDGRNEGVANQAQRSGQGIFNRPFSRQKQAEHSRHNGKERPLGKHTRGVGIDRVPPLRRLKGSRDAKPVIGVHRNLPANQGHTERHDEKTGHEDEDGHEGHSGFIPD